MSELSVQQCSNLWINKDKRQTEEITWIHKGLRPIVSKSRLRLSYSIILDIVKNNIFSKILKEHVAVTFQLILLGGKQEIFINTGTSIISGNQNNNNKMYTNK